MTDDAEIKALTKKRGSFKGQLTIFSTYLTNLQDIELDASSARELQLRTGKIESLYEQYDAVQLQLECQSETPDVQLSERTAFEAQYFRALVKAQDIFSSYNNLQNEKDDLKSCMSRNSSNNHKLVKLPTIQLPKFSGSYNNWLEFKDTFSSLIHDNDDIDVVNKFHYLRSSLEGSAAVALQSVEFSASNYKLAWELLCDRFDNKRLLIQNHVSSLFNTEPITRESSSIIKNLIDHLNKNLRSLKSLGEPVDSWDTLLIHIVTSKLDSKTIREWEESKGRVDKNTVITFTYFIDFLRSRANLIETLELTRNSHSHSHANSNKSNTKLKTMISVPNASSHSCPKCHGEHHLNNCSQFLSLSNNDRKNLLLNFKMCHNCFRSGHYSNQCKKTGCKVCKRKHNTLIHVADYRPNRQNNNEPPSTAPSAHSDVHVQSSAEPRSSAVIASSPNLEYVSLSACVVNDSAVNDVLLSTALVKVYDANNCERIVRAVLDSGSTSCLMTNRLCELLNLPVVCVDKTILGVNNSQSQISKMCRVRMRSLNDSYSGFIQCFTLPSITNNVPHDTIDLSKLQIPTDICLADPGFYKPAAVDLIIGADIFWDLLGSQRIKLGQGQPILHETRLGWLISGPINSGHSPTRTNIICNLTQVDPNVAAVDNEFVTIQNQISRFWQLEEVSPKLSNYSSEEKRCEEHFVNNTTRTEDGRFCVRIPLKESPQVLGESLTRAKKCMLSLERRNEKQPEFNIMYKNFMSEYSSLGHMTECSFNSEGEGYFIPHHGVLRDSSTTTKLRVVFNASSPTSSGISLNHIQMVGPTVQDDLLSILIRFRFYKYVLSADIEKMYRQIIVCPQDRHLQQIVWRSDTSSPLKPFELNTITYGTASAPFLATRCLKQLGLECPDKQISNVIIHDFYVDDLLTGADNFNEALNLRKQVSTVLLSACMPLRKWKSNEPSLLTDGTDSPAHLSLDLNMGGHELTKTLGLGWQTQHDYLCFPTGIHSSGCNSKRDILSIIAQIFDPLGLLSPCVVLMKMTLQRLWLLKSSWDEPLPEDISKQWFSIIKSLPALLNLHIPRRVVCDKYKQLDLHIFCDASERAYGACVYVCSTGDSGKVSVCLLMGKSRVAPIKPTTVPRLELCAALVGARLYEKLLGSMRGVVRQTTFWSDSMVVLGWLKMLPSRLQPFVRNRVAEISEITSSCTWRHVPTNENPADLISRGVDPTSIEGSRLWWFGPTFLEQNASHWPRDPKESRVKLPETRPEITLHCNALEKRHNMLDFSRFSNFLRLQRCVAYVLRFINRFVIKREPKPVGALSACELQNALFFIIRLVQADSFEEYKLLLNKQRLPNKSLLHKFNVFIDENRIMRVGGRLFNSTFSYDKKFPILIQSTHQFTKLLFTHEHKRLLHAPPQLLLATIKESFWPIRGRNLAKLTYHRCVTCCGMKGNVVSPLMGNLPPNRVLPGTYPFQNVGVDYAGPILAANRQGRGCKIIKVYIAIFICLATKCIHLELVSDLTSNCFLLALRRFISRRGKPSNIYSDNGTSFVGAYNDLSKFLKLSCNSVCDEAANEGINFHFIPAYAPHFGGLWEAGVKSTKFHLVRVLGNCHLSFEELNTTLVQIEAILNSRPLTQISSDPADFTPLTPGHFIIGRSLSCLPTADIQDHSSSNLSRFHRIERLRQHFWSRWSKEYVSELQQRVKWRSNQSALRINSLVLLKEDKLPPLKWKLGRIVAVHPGTDGISRVADIKISNGVVRRAFSKICPLPVEEEVDG